MERPASLSVSVRTDQSLVSANSRLSTARTFSTSPGLSTTSTSLYARSSVQKQRYFSGRCTGLDSVTTCSKRMEPLFKNLHIDHPGLWVWRVEKRSLVLLDDQEHGFFHEGAAHIVLRISEDDVSSLHWWIGEECSPEDIATAEVKVSELDRIIGYANILTRDVQAFESSLFMKNFPVGVIYIEGKPKTSVKKSASYKKKMYRVSGRTYSRAVCLIPSVEHLDDEHSFILDGHPRIYVWNGSNCSYVQRVKAIQIARKIRDCQRNKRTHVIVIDGKDEKLQEAFIKKLPTNSVKGTEGDDIGNIVKKRDPDQIVLYRVTGERVEYDMPEAARRPLYQRYLVTNDSYLLDSGPLSPVCVWVGAQAHEDHVGNALKRGMIFSDYQGYPHFLPICRIREEYEPASFKRVFSDWRDRCFKNKHLTKKYTVGNVGRALFSRSDRRTIAKVNETWADGNLPNESGHTEIWQVDDNSLKPVPIEHYGVFVNGNCYIISHKSSNGLHCKQIIYYWWGSKSSLEMRLKSTELALSMDEGLQHQSVLVRVIDGEEPQHFMSVLQNCIMVYDLNVKAASGAQMFRVTERNAGSMHIQQAIQIARKIRDCQRNKRTHVIVIGLYGKDEKLQEAFIKKLPTNSVKGTEGDDIGNIVKKRDPDQIVLYRVTGERVEYDMPEAARRPLYQRYLVTNDSYLLDSGPLSPVCVWVGAQAHEDHMGNALKRGMIFSDYQGYPHFLPICRIREEYEPASFKRVFSDWRDRCFKNKHLTKKYTVGNVGRALFSRSDRRTIAKVNETWADGNLPNESGHTEIWQVDDNSLKPVPIEHYGVFVNGNCYIISHKSSNGLHCKQIIYYWWGSKSSLEMRLKSTELALSMDEGLQHQSVLVRVIDGEEPQHFMSVLQNCIMVYDLNVKAASGAQMFRVTERNAGSMHIQQMLPGWSSLNSVSTFVLMTPRHCLLWYGKKSGSAVREYAKNMLSFLNPSRMYDYNVELEDKESTVFWNILGLKDDYSPEPELTKLERRAPRLSHFQQYGDFSAFEDVDNFQRKDLSEYDLMVMDTFDQIFIWCGANVDLDCRKLLPNLPKAYTTTDPAGRKFEQVQLWYVSQNYEPDTFTTYFPEWSSTEYGGENDYNMLRKSVRQENARIDITAEVTDRSYFGSPKYSYKVLLRRDVPDDVNVYHKEYHLTEKKFRESLRLTRTEFYSFPLWKQTQILKAVKLYHRNSGTTTTCKDGI
ncbi:hypothetical protein ScPMuIL_017386 [Solemya velum]